MKIAAIFIDMISADKLIYAIPGQSGHRLMNACKRLEVLYMLIAIHLLQIRPDLQDVCGQGYIPKQMGVICVINIHGNFYLQQKRIFGLF